MSQNRVEVMAIPWSIVIKINGLFKKNALDVIEHNVRRPSLPPSPG